MFLLLTQFFLCYLRFFRQFLAFFGIHQMALSLFRFIAAVGRTQVVANTLGTFTLLLVFVLGGFIVAKSNLSQSICKPASSIDLLENKFSIFLSFRGCRWHWAMDDMGLLYFPYDVWAKCDSYEWISWWKMECGRISSLFYWLHLLTSELDLHFTHAYALRHFWRDKHGENDSKLLSIAAQSRPDCQCTYSWKSPAPVQRILHRWVLVLDLYWSTFWIFSSLQRIIYFCVDFPES